MKVFLNGIEHIGIYLKMRRKEEIFLFPKRKRVKNKILREI